MARVLNSSNSSYSGVTHSEWQQAMKRAKEMREKKIKSQKLPKIKKKTKGIKNGYKNR